MEAIALNPTLTAQADTVKITKATAGLTDGDKAKLKKSCQDFESILIGMMMREMESTVHEEKLFSGGKGAEIFKDMKIDAMAADIAKGNAFGLSSVLYDQLVDRNAKAVTAKKAFSAYGNRR
jgi:Rod binding domain-containing protein